ncbi:SRPBCC family protein [Bounagaea algeriensis]
MADDNEAERGAGRSLFDELPIGHLKSAGKELLDALVTRAIRSVSGKVDSLTGRLTDVAENGGSGLMAAVTGAKEVAEGGSPAKGALKAGVTGVKEKAKEAVGAGSSGGSSGGGGSSAKVVNILEEFDVGLPLRVAYNQWTQFQDYPGFTRKVESAEQESDEKVNWKAQVFLSHRSWESTIIEQVPDERIVWRSKGSKGHVDGAVTFHELAPSMTRVLLVLEYHPQGFFEKTANLWRAQGRRARSDFRHIKRHMMTSTILEQEESEGWRGEIRDREVVRSHEDVLREEQESNQSEDHDYQEDEEPDYDDEQYAEDDYEAYEDERGDAARHDEYEYEKADE